MTREVRHARKLTAGAIAVLVLAGASTSGAASTDDPFDHTPNQVECHASDVYVILTVDTTKITTPTSGPAVVSLSSGVGTFGYSPGPLGFPVSPAGSVYWTIPFDDFASTQITWTLKTQSDGTPIDSGTIAFDFVGLCGTTPTTAPPSTTSTSTPVPAPAVAAEAVVDSAASGRAPVPVAAASVTGTPMVTG